MAGPIRLPARFVAAGALFHTGQVFLWGEPRLALVRFLDRTPLVEHEINWVLYEAAPPAPGSGPEAREELQKRVKASGKYFGEPNDPRSNLWCGGFCFLADGRLLMAGADCNPKNRPETIDRRANVARYLDPGQRLFGFAPAPDMHLPRWYPGMVTLPDGRALVSFGVARRLEVFDPATGAWTLGASTDAIEPGGLFNDYPWTFVMPDGQVLMTGAWGPMAYSYDPARDEITPVGGQTHQPKRHGGSAVLMVPAQAGRVMVLGGGEEHKEETASVEVYDPASAKWTARSPMHHGRHHPGSVVLPDGRIWVTGGGGGRFHLFQAVGRETELYDPERDVWIEAASLIERRGYHHVLLLLPDASVLVAGEQPTAEVYYPPYFYRGPRPAVRACPSDLNYGGSFRVEVDSQPGDPIAQIVLARPGTMTHSYNFDQRLVTLSFSLDGAEAVQASVPTTPNHAPPGYYMLFLVSQSGLPSRAAAWVRLS